MAIRASSRALAISAAVLSSCAYSFRGNLPGHIESVRVAPFRSTVSEYGLEQETTSLVTEKLVESGGLSVVTSSPDALIEASVSQWIRSPYSYSASEQIEEYRLEMRVTLDFTDLVRDEPILDDEPVSRWIVYNPQTEDYASARARLVEDMASEIVRRCLSGW